MRPKLFILSAALGLVCVQPSLAQQPPTLSRLAPATPVVVTELDVVRQQRIEILQPRALADPASRVLSLELFPDLTVQAVREYAEPTLSGMSWVGRLEGYPTSTVVFVLAGDELAGHIYAPFGFFRIEPGGNATYVVQQVVPERYPEPSDVVMVPDSAPPSNRRAISGPYRDDGSVIDLLIVYTRDAVSNFGGEQRAQAALDLVVAETNQALRATGVASRVRVVHSTTVDYAETADSLVDLSRIQNPTDSFMDSVPALRDRYAADLVALITERAESNICGRGYLADARGLEQWGFSVTKRDCTRNGRTLAHEIGHNLGAHHDWYETAEGGAYQYSKGYVSLTGRFLDVMAYYNLCRDTGTSCQQLLAYSSPSSAHNGQRTGVAAGTNTTCTAGNRSNPQCDADVGRTFAEMAGVVATYRDSRLSLSSRQLLPGASFRSDDSRYRLTLQTDGNLVLYDDRVREALWSTGTTGIRPRELILQTDGNLVLYDTAGCARWASGSGGNTNSYLVVQTDANVVIYRPDGRAAWNRYELGSPLSC